MLIANEIMDKKRCFREEGVVFKIDLKKLKIMRIGKDSKGLSMGMGALEQKPHLVN